MLQLVKVNSSMLYAVAYDEGAEALEAVFFTGVYRYSGVPRDIFEALVAAPSVGRYMHDHVLRRYPYELLRGEQQREETSRLHATPPM